MTTRTPADVWAQGWCEGVKAGWAATGATPPDSWTGANPYEDADSWDEGYNAGFQNGAEAARREPVTRHDRPERRTARNAVAAKERAEDDLTVLRHGVQLIITELESVISMLMEDGDTHDAVIAGTHRRVADQLRVMLRAAGEPKVS